MGLDPINAISSAPSVSAPSRASAAKAYEIARQALESIGDRQHVLHEILYPLAEASPSSLRARMLADIPQDGAQTYRLAAHLPSDVQALDAILERLIADFGG